MAVPHPARERHTDRDGITRLAPPKRSGGAWLVGAAVFFTLACLGVSAWLLWAPVPHGEEASAPPDVTPTPAPAPAALSPRPVRRPARTVLASAPVPPAAEESPSAMADEPSEERSGLALFPAPGTKPLKRGILVPEDFPLPEGYVRHYQATDDGERVPAILMFHPDHPPRDASGRPLPMPEDRLVPPELAPPGMPIQMLKLPGDDAAGKEP